MKKIVDKKQIKESLECLFLKTFQVNENIDTSENKTLEQPHAFEYVHSVTTYGAFQKPI
jgi:hypothetical protein